AAYRRRFSPCAVPPPTPLRCVIARFGHLITYFGNVITHFGAVTKVITFDRNQRSSSRRNG
ncbi:hypothetical protein, partial [Ralstonia solanacearum]|uniref:hypothetical protein n=1 Tax=Ralstonia solanacearum TaxID=305 RepID=UPI001E4155BB